MNRKLAGALAAAAALVSLTGCTHLDGTVIGKGYTPSHTDYVMRAHYRQQCTSSYSAAAKSTSRSCTQVFAGMWPDPVYYRACYSLAVKQDEDGKVKSKCVKSEQYASVEVGDHFSEED